jgi:hypothetical protein
MQSLISQVLIVFQGIFSVGFVACNAIASSYISRGSPKWRGGFGASCSTATSLLLRLIMIWWMFAAGLGITFIVARHLFCRDAVAADSISFGECVLQRSGIGTAIFALYVLFPLLKVPADSCLQINIAGPLHPPTQSSRSMPSPPLRHQTRVTAPPSITAT